MDLSPALALVRRELLSSLRRPRSFVLLVGFVLAAELAVYGFRRYRNCDAWS